MNAHRLVARQNSGLRMRFVGFGCFALSVAMLSGCGLAEVERARMETGDVARQVSALRAPHAGPRLSTVRLIERRPYVGLTRIEPDPRAGLPARYRGADAVTLPLAGIGAAAVLAGRIEAATGLAVRFTGPPRRAEDTTGGDTPVNVLGEAGRDGLSPDGGIWTGPLDALLDAWTEPSGYEWRYDADRQAIEIVRRRSAVFHIHALAGTQRYTVSASTQDSAAGDGGGNLTSQTISTETDYDPWPEIEGQLKGLLDPGTRLSVAPSSGSVTVSGTPRDIARARAYLGYLNREVLRPVTLSVHVYSVRVEREADYDLGLSFSIARLLGEALRVSVGSNAVARRNGAGAPETADADRLIRAPAMDARFRRICAVFAGGRCLIARGYEADARLRSALLALRQSGAIPAAVAEETATLEEIAVAWRAAGAASSPAAGEAAARRIKRLFEDAAAARASDVVFQTGGGACHVFAIVNDRKLPLAQPLTAEEGREAAGLIPSSWFVSR